eukprot:g3305.t1
MQQRSRDVKEWKEPWPPCSPTLPKGFDTSGCLINSLLLGGNVDYYAANRLVPLFMAIGLDTPNKVTILNCAVPRVIACVLNVLIARGTVDFDYIWICPVIWIVSNVLDAADGQMARRYGLGSAFGQWLDHFTDECFGYSLGATFGYLCYMQFGIFSFQMCCFFLLLAFIGIVGKANIEAKEAGTRYPRLSVLEKIGIWVELSMDNIFIAAVWIPFLIYRMRSV